MVVRIGFRVAEIALKRLVERITKHVLVDYYPN
jgi:hypothetical protein